MLAAIIFIYNRAQTFNYPEIVEMRDLDEEPALLPHALHVRDEEGDVAEGIGDDDEHDSRRQEGLPSQPLWGSRPGRGRKMGVVRLG